MTTRSFHQPDPSDHRSLAPKRRRRFRISLPSGQRLTAEELDQVWAAYRADRSDLRLRNRLVEHYLPWAGNLAASIAGRMELRDRENAVGEVLAALVAFIVPDYSGHGSFQRWACICIKRKLIDLQRTEQVGESCGDLPAGGLDLSALELLPNRDGPRYEMDFLELTAKLTDRQATVLWLRHYRGMEVEAVAELLKASPRSVELWTREALNELKNLWHDCA
jgi:RNA polymerase sigma factor (sigma-70 family)